MRRDVEAASAGPGPHTCVAETLALPSLGTHVAEYWLVLTHVWPVGQHSWPPQHTAPASGQQPKPDAENSTSQHVCSAPQAVRTPAGHVGDDEGAAKGGSSGAAAAAAAASSSCARSGVILAKPRRVG